MLLLKSPKIQRSQLALITNLTAGQCEKSTFIFIFFLLRVIFGVMLVLNSYTNSVS